MPRSGYERVIETQRKRKTRSSLRKHATPGIWRTPLWLCRLPTIPHLVQLYCLARCPRILLAQALVTFVSSIGLMVPARVSNGVQNEGDWPQSRDPLRSRRHFADSKFNNRSGFVGRGLYNTMRDLRRSRGGAGRRGWPNVGVSQ
jgi:hypothetical protein